MSMKALESSMVKEQQRKIGAITSVDYAKRDRRRAIELAKEKAQDQRDMVDIKIAALFDEKLTSLQLDEKLQSLQHDFDSFIDSLEMTAAEKRTFANLIGATAGGVGYGAGTYAGSSGSTDSGDTDFEGTQQSYSSGRTDSGEATSDF